MYTIINTSIEAYLDPGSGSVLIQLILGALFSAGVLIRIFWKKIQSFFGKSKKINQDPTMIASDPTDLKGLKE